MATMTTKRAPKASADLLRRKRRRARRHGPSPATRARLASCSNAAGPSNVNSVAGSVATATLSLTRAERAVGGRLGALPPASIPLLQTEQCPVVLVDRMDARAVLEVHPLREERGGQLAAVDADVALIDQLLVERRPLISHVLWLLGLQLLERRVDPGRGRRVLEVEHRRRRQRRSAQVRLEEIVRVREVLEPVREAGLGLGLLRPDRPEVHLLVEDL